MRSAVILILVLVAATFGCKKKGSVSVPYVHETKDHEWVINANCVKVGEWSAYCVENGKYKICDQAQCLDLPTPPPCPQ